MKDIVEGLLYIALGLLIVVVSIALMTLPSAFLGFILLASANVFSAGVTITYFSSAVVGLTAFILISLISK